MSASPSRGGYGYGGYGGAPGGGGQQQQQQHLGVDGRGFRPATPNRRGQYSDAVLNELESQNDSHVEGILGKVRVLKDVSLPFLFCHPPSLLEVFEEKHGYVGGSEVANVGALDR